MSTRKLLESAAKAAKMTHLTYCEAWDCMAVYNPEGYFEWKTCWNPIKNSDDAIDLISRLSLNVMGHTDGVTVSNLSGTVLIEVEYSRDCEAQSIRLAITTVAAAIGESM